MVPTPFSGVPASIISLILPPAEGRGLDWLIWGRTGKAWESLRRDTEADPAMGAFRGVEVTEVGSRGEVTAEGVGWMEEERASCWSIWGKVPPS